ncbi:PelD GGDEF domain-containing protein [Burkholderia sp. MR1-5-21]
MAIDTKSTRFDAGIDTRPDVQQASRRSRFLRLTSAARFASLLPREHSASYVALETLVLSVAVFAVCRVLSPADPLLIGKAFPWLWLLPLFVALRYGTVAGLGGGALLFAAWVVFYAQLPLADVFPRDFFVGGFITMLVAGQFSDTWATRLSQARVSNTYLSERLSVLTNNQFLLRLSHDQLEQDLLVRPATLRDALARLRDITLRGTSGSDMSVSGTTVPLPGAQSFLEAVTQACQIEAAQIHAWHDGELDATPIAGIGRQFEFDAGDPLVTTALDELALAHLQSLDVRERARTRYVACAPLIGADDAVVGVLVVSELPFLALTSDNLQLMFVMCSYYANGVRHAAITRDVLQSYPDCPYDFALEYARLADLQRTSGVASSVVMLLFDASRQAQAMFDYVERTNLDFHVQWVVHIGAKRGLVFIMPLSSDATVDAQVQRIETDVRNQFGIGFTEARVVARRVSLAGTPSDGALRQLLADCDEAA